MEPRIQYAKTSDGVNIAYAVLGSGPAIVFPSAIWGNVHLYKSAVSGRNPTQFRVRAIYDELVSLGWSVITYDGRGCGASDRDVDDYTLDGKLRDVEAVIEPAAPERFALCGAFHGGLTSIAYAARHPDKVTHLVLTNTFANAAEYNELEPSMRLRDVLRDAESEWEFATLTIANALTGYTDSELARRFAQAFRKGMTAKGYMGFRDAADKIDVRDLLPQIGVPTLVVHDTTAGQQGIGLVTQRLAPLIPNARFVETDEPAKIIDEFLRDGGPVTAPEPVLPSGMTAILFADIADSTALTERLGDAAFREKARELDAALRTIIREHAGTAIEGKLLGDGVLAVFTSARQAIEAALACAKAGAEASLPLHLGLHAGDVIREDNNVYGGAVNIASRIAGLSAAGEVLVSETVRSLARTSAGVRFEDRGEQAVKGVGEPVRMWAVCEGG
jgi:class 3 adenylate cyclase